MRNPFLELHTKEEREQGEEVEGSFACQQRGCYSVVGDAIYLPMVNVLTWKCNEGHTNKIERRLD